MSFRERSGVSRREFFGFGAAGAAAALAAGCRTPGPPAKVQPLAQTPTPVVQPPPPPYGRYEMGAQTYSFRDFRFDDMIAKVEQLGLHFVEIYDAHLPRNSTPEQFAAAKAKMAARQITANAYWVGGLDKNEGNARNALNFTKALGAGVAVGDPAPDCLDVLDKVVAETGIKVGIHNHGPGTRWSKTDDMLKALGNHNAGIGICLDTGHLTRSGENPVESARKLGPRLLALHIKDLNAQNADVIVGKGRLDLVGFFTALKEIHFGGPIALEYEIDPKDPVPGMAASLAAIREAIARVG
jgi:sugar phosphate isomerase/epimerase